MVITNQTYGAEGRGVLLRPFSTHGWYTFTPPSLVHFIAAADTQALTREEAAFFEQIDQLYLDLFRSSYFGGGYVLVRGATLWNLWNLIGHVEAELRFQSLARTRRVVDPLVRRCQSGAACIRLGRYENLAGATTKPIVDAAYEEIRRSQPDENAFWLDFFQWLGEAKGEFTTTVFGQKVRGKYYPDMHAYLTQQAKIAAASLELSGQLPDVRVQESLTTGRIPEYAFIRQGDNWLVVFQGRRIWLDDTKGVRYIAILLGNPGKPFLATHLVMHVHGAFGEPNERYSGMSVEELREEGLDSIGIAEQDVEKHRTSVAHAIGAVLKKLNEDHGALYDHLHASLKPGKYVSYQPTSPVTWDLG